MSSFYIFLDIDGVLYDWDYIIAETNAGLRKRGEFIKKFKPESMQAINMLIEELNKDYEVGLVISSTWRSNMPFTIQTLQDNGLEYDKPIERTPIYDPAKRGEQILDYLADKKDYDFVIIDELPAKKLVEEAEKQGEKLRAKAEEEITKLESKL